MPRTAIGVRAELGEELAAATGIVADEELAEAAGTVALLELGP